MQALEQVAVWLAALRRLVLSSTWLNDRNHPKVALEEALLLRANILTRALQFSNLLLIRCAKKLCSKPLVVKLVLFHF